MASSLNDYMSFILSHARPLDGGRFQVTTTYGKDKAVVNSSNFFFFLGSFDRFLGGFKFEHDLVFRFSVYFYLNDRRSDHNNTLDTVLEGLR